MTTLVTARLRLEPFADDHAPGLHAMNTDPEVMRYLGGPLAALDETVAIIGRVQRRWAELGHSWWSFIDRDSGELVGAGAVQHLRRDAAPEPDPACPLEIGWRLRRAHWRQGLATEAAWAMAGFAFDTLQADALHAVCHPDNTASARVMQRLGMVACGQQTWFGKPLATYRVDAAPWRAARMAATPGR